MSTAAIVAGLMGQWAEAASLVFLYSISEAAEGYTGERARHAIRALMDLAPKTALVRRDDRETRIPVEQLRVEDVFIVLPGESIATDGEVIDGHSSVNQAPITVLSNLTKEIKKVIEGAQNILSKYGKEIYKCKTN